MKTSFKIEGDGLMLERAHPNHLAAAYSPIPRETAITHFAGNFTHLGIFVYFCKVISPRYGLSIRHTREHDMLTIVNVEYEGCYTLLCEFSDGVRKRVDHNRLIIKSSHDDLLGPNLLPVNQTQNVNARGHFCGRDAMNCVSTDDDAPRRVNNL